MDSPQDAGAEKRSVEFEVRSRAETRTGSRRQSEEHGHASSVAQSNTRSASSLTDFTIEIHGGTEASTAQEDVGLNPPYGHASIPGSKESEIGGSQSSYAPKIGYPAVCNFMGTEPDFLVFRRFTNLSIRNILYIQDQLQEIEEELTIIDAEYPATTRREDGHSRRKELMHELQVLIVKYEQAVMAHENLLKYQSAPDRRVKSVRTYIQDRVDAGELDPEEAAFISSREYRPDLFALHRVERQTLVKLFDSSRLLQRLFPKSTPATPHQPEGVVTYSDTAVLAFSRVITLVGSWIFLLLPIIFLAGPIVEIPEKWRVLIVGGAIIVFSAVLSLFTKTKDWEMLAATAGYSAVLVVFLGNGPNGFN